MTPAVRRRSAPRHGGCRRAAAPPQADRYLIAATAHQHGLGVLHYDRDYDLHATHSGLRFASVWVAEAGSLDATG